MSLKFRLTSVFAVALAVSGFTVAASAQDAAPAAKEKGAMHEKGEGRGSHMGGEKGKRGGGMGLRGLRGIELTAAQKEQVRAIYQANPPDKSKMEEMRSLMEAKRAGTLTPEQKETFKAFRENRRAKAEQLRSQIDAILTPEQRQQVEAKRQEMKQRREERRLQRGAEKTDTKPTDN